ncbi:MAG TPA: threonine synthase [Planctomycetota bacterium]|nr:threonine synthase [Planctomycetota bacterium]
MTAVAATTFNFLRADRCPEPAQQVCINPDCGAQFPLTDVLTACKQCGALLDIAYNWTKQKPPKTLAGFEAKYATRRSNPLHFSGVWKFKELLNFAPDDKVATIGEGQTLLRCENRAARYAGVNAGQLFLQYEGLNPSGSFKDNGMSAAFSHARMVGAKVAACASTGNTSASLAAYAAQGEAFGAPGMKAIVFVGAGKIAMGKLSQALDYGSLTLQVDGDFDDAMQKVQEVSKAEGIYLVNSVNPFRLEGQKTIMLRVLEGLGWQAPDWIVVPGGNLGNCSAFAKAFAELKHLGLIDRIPRLAVINARGARTFTALVNERGVTWNDGRPDKKKIDGYYAELKQKGITANTLASAIEINRPVNLHKALRALAIMNGVVRDVGDGEILDAKAVVGACGIGCEPASAASVAGLKNLVAEGVIRSSDKVVCILTGHQLKDPTATVEYHTLRKAKYLKEYTEFGVCTEQLQPNRPVPVANDLAAIIQAIHKHQR